MCHCARRLNYATEWSIALYVSLRTQAENDTKSLRMSWSLYSVFMSRIAGDNFVVMTLLVNAGGHQKGSKEYENK